MACYDQPLHDAACEALRELVEEGDHAGLIAAVHALVISTITHESRGVELEVARELRAVTHGCSHLRELLHERGRL